MLEEMDKLNSNLVIVFVVQSNFLGSVWNELEARTSVWFIPAAVFIGIKKAFR